MIGEGDSLALQIWNMYTEWKSPRLVAEQRWAETKKYTFATSTKETTNAQNPWSNTVHRPKLYHIYNNLLVNTDFSLFPSRDWLEFESFDQQSNSKQKRDAATAYLRTKHRLSGFRKVMRDLISDWLLYGNCFAGVEYVTEYTKDEVTGEDRVSYIGPRPYRISPYDIVFNAVASSFKSSPKIVRIRKSMGELKKELKDNPGLNYDSSIVDKMIQDRDTLALDNYRFEPDAIKDLAFQADGYGSMADYYKSGYVLIHEFYGDIYDRQTGEFLENYVVTVADGRYLLRKEPLNTYSGKPNLFHSTWKQRPDNLWGFGPLDNLIGLQYRINHLENARDDAFDQMLDPDMVFMGDPEIEQVGAATYYYFSEQGDAKPLSPDTTVLNANMQIQEFEQAMEAYAGAPGISVGIRSPGEKTKFEVGLLNNNADRVFEYQTNIFSDFVEDIVNAELEEAKKNLVTSDVISILDPTFGVENFVKITKEDLISNGKVVPVGARESARKAKLAQQLQQFYASGLQDPEVLQHFPSKKIGSMWADLLDFDKLYEPFGRIPERLEAQRLQMSAQDMLKEESMIDPTGMSEIPPNATQQ